MTQILRQSTQIVVHIGPFVDVTDGLTPEVAVTLSGADEAEIIKANATTTTSISAATWAAITGCDGWYALTLTTSHTDTVGTLRVIVQDDSVCLPVFQSFQIVEEAVFDAYYAASADMAVTLAASGITAIVDEWETQSQADPTGFHVNLLEINGSATAAQYLAKTTAVIGRGTCTTGGTTTSVVTNAFLPAGVVLDQFKGRVLTFDADTTTTALRGQSTDITGSSAVSTPTFTVSTLTTAPADTDTFSIT